MKQVRAFMETKVAPIITQYWGDDFPFEVLPAIKDLHIGGIGMKGYGCRGGAIPLSFPGANSVESISINGSLLFIWFFRHQPRKGLTQSF